MSKITFAVFLFLLSSLGCLAQTDGSEGPRVHFHHVHLNVSNPEESIKFYTSKFDCERATFAGQQGAVWAQKSWLLFNKVASTPKLDLTSAIWHIGWGAENMKETYQKQLSMGTKFFEPLTDISDIGGNVGAKDTFYYCYVQSPDNALIELNTARHHNFGHLHLFSADPVGAAEWWGKNFGVKLSPALKNPKAREPRIYRTVQIGPSASFNLDNVNVIIFPIEYPKKAYADQWKGRTSFDSTKGKAIDHIAISVEKLDKTLAELKANGVRILQGPKMLKGTKIRSAFIEGPDQIMIEVVEGQADRTASR